MNLRNRLRMAREEPAKKAIIIAGQQGLLNTTSAHAVLNIMPHEEQLLRATQMQQARKQAKTREPTGRTLLMNAARKGDLQRTLELLKNDAHVEVEDYDGRNALHWACIGVDGRYSAEHPAVLEALLHPPGRSANLKVVRRNRPPGSALIDGVEIIDKGDKYRWFPLAYACSYGNPELVQILLNNGANTEIEHANPLIVATESDNEYDKADVIRVLLRHGANVEGSNPLYSTPLLAACNNDNDRIEPVNILLEAGANIMAIDKEGDTCIHFAAYKHNINIIRLLVSKGVDVNVQNQPPPGAHIFRHTPLACLCFNYVVHVDTARVLLELGAGINIQNDSGDTALHAACSHDNHVDPELIRLLITNGAGINIQNGMGHTPLHTACIHNLNTEITQLLITNGADVNAQNGVGDTPLHVACKHRKRPELIRFLIANGANVEALNLERQTPFDVITDVQEYGDPWIREVRQIFREAGVAIPIEEGLNVPLLDGGRRRTKRTRKTRRRR